jgi:glutamyl-tRNA synthetase
VTSISDFQAMGFIAPALANYMTLLGWSAPDGRERFSLAEAAELFSFDRVNKAGARFDWDKLDWLNGQYLHDLEPAALLELVLPHLQGAGYGPYDQSDRPWLLDLMALVGPSLTRLTDAVPQSQLLLTPSLDYQADAQAQLQQAGVGPVLEAILTGLTSPPAPTTLAQLKSLVEEVVQGQGVKKGLVMKSLRAALMGTLQGPDLIESWWILRQRQVDGPRLQGALALIA